MADWDEEEEVEAPPAVVAVRTKRWDDEDEEDDIKDSWDAEDEDEEEAGLGKAPEAFAGPVRNKVGMGGRIAERKAEEDKENQKKNEASKIINESEAERRQRLKQEQLDSDLQNANDLFSGVELKPKTRNTSGNVADLLDLKPSDKDDFDDFSRLLVELCARHKGQPLYDAFLQDHVRSLLLDRDDILVRKISATLGALANEKQAEKKERQKGGKKKTTTGKVAPAATMAKAAGGGMKRNLKVDTDTYDDFEDDDFM